MTDVAKDGFGRRRLKALGYDALAQAVVDQTPFTGRQIMQLVNAPVPVLAKLIELRGAATAIGRLAPVYYFPLAAAVEASGAAEAAERCVEALLSVAATNAPTGIVIDRWTGDFTIELLADAIALTQRRAMLESIPAPYFTGPSTGELKRIVRNAVQSQGNTLETLLPLLREAGIATVEGGTDLTVHERALSCGLRTVMAHDLTRSRLTRAVLIALPDAAKSQLDDVGLVHAPAAVGQQFVATLQAIAETIQPYSDRATWSPAASAALDVAASPESPLGAEIISAIAIARLVLPKAASVRAPLSLMGVKAAHTALLFGADDLGFAALDSETAMHLALPLYAEIAGTIELAVSAKPVTRELTTERTTGVEL